MEEVSVNAHLSFFRNVYYLTLLFYFGLIRKLKQQGGEELVVVAVLVVI